MWHYLAPDLVSDLVSELVPDQAPKLVADLVPDSVPDWVMDLVPGLAPDLRWAPNGCKVEWLHNEELGSSPR